MFQLQGEKNSPTGFMSRKFSHVKNFIFNWFYQALGY